MFEFRVLEFELKYFGQTGIASSGVCLKILYYYNMPNICFTYLVFCLLVFLEICILYTSGHTSTNAYAICLLYASIK